MTLGSHTYCSFCVNFFMNLADDELASDLLGAPTKSSGSPAPISQIFSYTLLLAPALISVMLSVVPSINNELFKRFMKAYLAAQGQPLALVPALTPT